MFEQPNINTENVDCSGTLKRNIRALAILGTFAGIPPTAMADEAPASTEMVEVESGYVTELRSQHEAQDEIRDTALNEMRNAFESITESLSSNDIDVEIVQAFLSKAQTIVDSYLAEVNRVQRGVATFGISEISVESLSNLNSLQSELLWVAAEGLESAQTDLHAAENQVLSLELLINLMTAPGSELRGMMSNFWENNPSLSN